MSLEGGTPYPMSDEAATGLIDASPKTSTKINHKTIVSLINYPNHQLPSMLSNRQTYHHLKFQINAFDPYQCSACWLHLE